MVADVLGSFSGMISKLLICYVPFVFFVRETDSQFYLSDSSQRINHLLLVTTSNSQSNLIIHLFCQISVLAYFESSKTKIAITQVQVINTS